MLMINLKKYAEDNWMSLHSPPHMLQCRNRERIMDMGPHMNMQLLTSPRRKRCVYWCLEDWHRLFMLKFCDFGEFVIQVAKTMNFSSIFLNKKVVLDLSLFYLWNDVIDSIKASREMLVSSVENSLLSVTSIKTRMEKSSRDLAEEAFHLAFSRLNC